MVKQQYWIQNFTFEEWLRMVMMTSSLYATILHAQDSWTSLPPLPVKWFGLGHLDGKPVAIGGANKNDDHQMTNKVHTLNSVHRWKQSMPSTPTPRSLPGVLSLPAALIVLSLIHI